MSNFSRKLLHDFRHCPHPVDSIPLSVSNGDFMLQNCYMDFKRWYKWKSPACLPNVSSSTYFFFLGKGKWGLGDVAKNETPESQITGKIFETRFSQILILVSLWSHFWKWAKLSHSLGSAESFVPWLEILIFGCLTFVKIFQGFFFFTTFSFALNIIIGWPAAAIGKYINPWLSYFPLELYISR